MNKSRFGNISVAVIAIGHGVTDLYANFLAALLPVFAEKFTLSKTSIGVMISVMGISGSMFQVVFGYLGDKWSRRFFLIVGPAVAGIMTLIGIAPNFIALIIILLLGGLGVSSFHPHAASAAGDTAGQKRDAGLGFFMAVGTLGYAVGPLIAASLMSSSAIGPARMPYFSVFGVITSILLYRYIRPEKTRTKKQETVSIFQIIRPEIKLLTILFAIVTLRATTNIVFVNFMSLMIQQRQLSLMIGALVLFVFSLSTALGTFMGGYISNWISRKNLLVYSMLLSSPLLIAMLYTDGVLFVIFLVLSGITVSCSNPANLAIAQEAIPKGASTASSLMMGVSWGVAAILAMFFGIIADLFGGNVVPAMGISAVLPILAAMCALLLPRK
jgi:FSR family fosmidomycin resistance protein-like MFS transporter